MMGHGSDDHHIHVYKLLIVVLVIFARSYDCQDFKSNNVQALSNLTGIEGAGKVQVHNNGQQGFHQTGEEGRSADVNQPVQDAVHIDFNQEKVSESYAEDFKQVYNICWQPGLIELDICQ